MKRPDELRPKLTPEEASEVERIIGEIEEHFSQSLTTLDIPLAHGQSEAAMIEVARRAKEAGWLATFQGNVLTIVHPG
jgi:hypothetical protein